MKALYLLSLCVVVVGSKKTDPCDDCTMVERCDSFSDSSNPCRSCDMDKDCKEPMDGMDEECATCGAYCNEIKWTANLGLECFLYCKTSGLTLESSDCVYADDYVDCGRCGDVYEELDCKFACTDKGCKFDEEDCSCVCNCNSGQGDCRGGWGCDGSQVCGEHSTEVGNCECRDCMELEDCESICVNDEVCRSMDGRTCECTSCVCAGCYDEEVCRETSNEVCECVLECEGRGECEDCDGNCIPFYPDGRPPYCVCVPTTTTEEPVVTTTVTETQAVVTVTPAATTGTCDEDSCKPACDGSEVCKSDESGGCVCHCECVGHGCDCAVAPSDAPSDTPTEDKEDYDPEGSGSLGLAVVLSVSAIVLSASL